MSKNYLILFVGLIVFLVPFLGFPRSWDVFLTAISGIVLIIVAVLSYARVRLEHSQYESHSLSPNPRVGQTPAESNSSGESKETP